MCCAIQPGFADALIARGNIFRKRGDIAMAEFNYNEANLCCTTTLSLALEAYCLTYLCRSPHEAGLSYQKLRSQGVEDAAVMNNCGFNLLQQNKLAQAKECFERAIELNPQLQPAYHNRAFLALKLAVRSANSLPAAGIEDIRPAGAARSAKRRAVLNASRLYIVASKAEPQWREPALGAGPGDRRGRFGQEQNPALQAADRLSRISNSFAESRIGAGCSLRPFSS